MVNRHTARVAAALLVLSIPLAGCGVNSVPTAEENAKAKWSNVEADYQRRADLIPNLVETVKGYAKQESTVLTQVVEARAKATSVQVSAGDLSDPTKVAAFQQAQGQLSSSLGRLLATVEAYPDLKSNQNFLALQSQLEGTENRINISIKDYNGAVQDYNYGSKPMTTYQATAPNADRAPAVKF
jgi:LemA protein